MLNLSPQPHVQFIVSLPKYYLIPLPHNTKLYNHFMHKTQGPTESLLGLFKANIAPEVFQVNL
jgi:hypothetical protein